MLKENINILQVLYSGLGGHGTVAFNLLDFFYEYDNFMFFYGIETLDEHYQKRIKDKNIISDYLAVQKKTKMGFKEWRSYYKFLKHIKPDVVLLHSPQLIIPTWLYAKLNGSKIITFEHDAISIRTGVKWMLTNINAILANHIVVLNPVYLKAVKQKLWYPKLIKKYRVIPNSIDTKKYKQNKNLFKQPVIQLLMASRINKLRDHQTLIEAVIKIHLNNPNIILKIAGDGESLQELKHKYANYNFVKFLGNLNEDDLLNELLNTDIYIHSTLAETFSTAILQAMSVGLPIITTDIEGTTHMIVHNENGLLFEPKNVEDLSQNIDFLINNQEKAIELGNKAHLCVLEKYATKQIKEQILNLL